MPQHLAETLEHVERVQMVRAGAIDPPELAPRFVLANRDISAMIPGMRKAVTLEGASPDYCYQRARSLL